MKAVTVASKSRQFTADKTGKRQFLRGNRRNSGRGGSCEREFVSTKVASVSNLCNNRNQGALGKNKAYQNTKKTVSTLRLTNDLEQEAWH